MSDNFWFGVWICPQGQGLLSYRVTRVGWLEPDPLRLTVWMLHGAGEMARQPRWKPGPLCAELSGQD